MPPADGQNSSFFRLREVVAAVVFTVRVAVCAVVPVIVTEAGRLHVAGSLAATGLTEQLRLTAPVNPPVGVRVMADVFPVVAPRTTVIAVPLIVKPGEMGVVTTTEVIPEPAL